MTLTPDGNQKDFQPSSSNPSVEGDKKTDVIEIVSDNATFSWVSLRCCQTSKMTLFAKMLIGFKLLNVFLEKANLEVWQEIKHTSDFASL